MHLCCTEESRYVLSMLQIPRLIARIPLVRGVVRLGLTAYARLFKRRYLIDRRMGLLLMFDQLNVIDWQLLISGTWEKPQLDKLFGLTREQLKGDRRSAVFFDVRVQQPGNPEETDAVQVGLEHESGYCVDVFFPYSRTAKGEVTYGTVFASKRDGVVFGTCK